MKKILLILLFFPIIGFGQDDCGKKPSYKGNKFNKINRNQLDYNRYKKKLKEWENCKNSNGINLNCKFTKSGKDEFDNSISYISEFEEIYEYSRRLGKTVYFETDFTFFYVDGRLGVFINSESDLKLNIDEDKSSLILLLDSNKLEFNINNSSYSVKSFSGTTSGTRLSNYNYYTGETTYTYIPGKSYAYDVYNSSLNYRLTLDDLSVLSQNKIKKLRLSFDKKNIDINLSKDDQKKLMFNANCITQAIKYDSLKIDDFVLKTKDLSKIDWQGNGSGVIISTSGHIVTNYHVIDNANEIAVEFKNNKKFNEFKAKIIKVDKTNDLAIIQIDDENFSNLKTIPYNFKTRSSDVGSEVFALGFPLALTVMGKDIKFTDGKISSKTGIDGDITSYQISAPILPGNSGGPLFDYYGNLIGINSAGLARGGFESVGYSIKTSYLLNLIDVLPESIKLPSSRELASKPLTEQIKILSDYVVLIKVK